MRYEKPSRTVKLLTAVLTLCVVLGAAFVGIHTKGTAAGNVRGASLPVLPRNTADSSFLPFSISSAVTNVLSSADIRNTPDRTGSPQAPDAGESSTAPDRQPSGSDPASEAERYYEAGSLPLFQIAFSQLDQEEQGKWLDRLYADGQIAFWGAAVDLLEENCPLLADYTQRAYQDDSIAYFSTLTMEMDQDALESWLDRALEDGKWGFQSVLFNALGLDKEFDELEEKKDKEWEEAQAAEYQAAGVTMDGKDYYYQGQLVNLFLDIRPDSSFYTLDMNPAGTVNIRIIRDADNQITGIALMTEAEVTRLLEDMRDEDEVQSGGSRDDAGSDGDQQEASGGRTWYPHLIPVDFETMADGEIVWLGEYTLSDGDRFWYSVSAETGNALEMGFAKSGDESLDTVYYFVHRQRQEDESLKCNASLTFGPPSQPGTYQLFLRAPDGPLGSVKGSVSIGFAAEATPYSG